MAGKWFRKYEDSDDSGSGSDSDSSSDSSSSTASSSSSSNQAPGLSAWLKKGRDDSDSDSEEDKGRKIQSKKSKNEEMMESVIGNIKAHLFTRDWARLLEDVDKLQKTRQRAGADIAFGAKEVAALERPFLCGLKHIQDFFAEPDNDPKVLSKNLRGKPQARPFSRFWQGMKKLLQEHEERLKDFKPDEGKQDSDSSSEELGDVDVDDEVRPQKEKQKSRAAEQKEERRKRKEEEAEEWTEEAIEKKLERVLAERGKKSTDRSKLVDELKIILGKTLAQTGMHHTAIRILSVLLSCQMDLIDLRRVMPTTLWRQCYDSITRLMNLLQDHPKVVIVDNDDRVEQEAAEEDETGGRRSKEHKAPADGRTRVEFLGTFHQIVERLADEYIKSLQQLDPHTQDYVTRLRDEGYLLDLAERVFVYYRDGAKTPARQQTAARIATRLMDHLYYRHQDDHGPMIQKQRQLTFERKGKKKGGKKGGKKAAAPEAPPPEEKKEEDEEEKKEGEEDAELVKAKQKAEEVAAALDARTKRPQKLVVTEDLASVLKYLHGFIQRNSTDDKQKTKAMLMYIYHLALHDRYSQARDLLLMSRHNAESPDHLRHLTTSQLMILYNRVLAQIGLAAFRAGEMHDTNCALNELCATARTREYLAQTIVRSFSRDKAEENAEKSRLVPFHMHINVDVLDGVHLIAAMLQEVPIRAQYPHDSKHRPLSKALQRVIYGFSHQVFLGPPETTKELIYAAFNALTEGNWREAHRLVCSMSLWAVLRNADKVKAMVTEKIKIVALRTYLFTFSRFYASVQLGELAAKYELPEERVHATVSRMIIRHEINAAWDQPKQCIRVESVNATKLQYLALQLADRCHSLVEYNEQRQAEKEARGERGFNPYQQSKAGGRKSQIGRQWESGAAGAARTANTTFKYNRTQEKDKRNNPFAQRRWGGK